MPVWRALRSFTKENGRVAFLMTSSMYSTIGAGGGRKWVTKFQTLKILDMTLITDIHEGALCWSYVPVIKNIEKDADKSLNYSFAIPTTKRTANITTVPMYNERLMDAHNL